MVSTLINAKTLQEEILQQKSRLIIVDCRHQLADVTWGQSAYEQGHIPNAVFLHLDHDLSGQKTGKNGRHPLPDKQDFVHTLGRVGIDNQTHIIAYDDGSMMYAARLWWLARFVGHEAIQVLDGGLPAWLAQNGSIQKHIPVMNVRQFDIQPSLEKVVDAAFVFANIKEKAYQLIDARSADRFRGENETMDPKGGHIPGAKNRCFKDNLQENGLMKSPKALKKEWGNYGDSALHIHQCGSGVSACVNILAQAYAGLPSGQLYAGSWSQWCADDQYPIACDIEN
ncbi:sulfurtransferase [Neisseria sp. Ec49-e6-T10]|uniref:sulfurtransferase n=1 Tax=Neisseria sp. Ec49-e6-T10 TaxID=3140744 RepID=UPI003EBFB2F3